MLHTGEKNASTFVYEGIDHDRRLTCSTPFSTNLPSEERRPEIKITQERKVVI
jgi:hypothetical protein